MANPALGHLLEIFCLTSSRFSRRYSKMRCEVRANQSLFLAAGAPNLDQNPDEKIDLSNVCVF